jgi:hypothetical protein
MQALAKRLSTMSIRVKAFQKNVTVPESKIHALAKSTPEEDCDSIQHASGRAKLLENVSLVKRRKNRRFHRHRFRLIQWRRSVEEFGAMKAIAGFASKLKLQLQLRLAFHRTEEAGRESIATEVREWV